MQQTEKERLEEYWLQSAEEDLAVAQDLFKSKKFHHSLFGSFAKGTAHAYSDIDLAVVSSQFGKDELREMMNLARWSLGASNRIEAVPITERMLASRYHPLIGEIKKWGRVVYEKAPADRS